MEPNAPSARVGGAGLLRNPFLWAFLIGIVSLTLIRPLLRREPPPPPVLAQVPAFTLTTADGDDFGSAQLAGNVYVASFFFTRCVSICPTLMQSIQRLERRYREAGVQGVHLVSITVDPDHDTPRRLRDYRAAYETEPSRWTLLTGAPETVRQVVVEGFRTAMGRPETGPGGLMDIAHTGRVVLVDGSGNIRGYYGTDPEGLDEVFHRSRHVLQETSRGP